LAVGTSTDGALVGKNETRPKNSEKKKRQGDFTRPSRTGTGRVVEKCQRGGNRGGGKKDRTFKTNWTRTLQKKKDPLKRKAQPLPRTRRKAEG